jgi:hypothetical protein
MLKIHWLQKLFDYSNDEPSKEELYQQAKLIITTTFDHQDDISYYVLPDHTYRNFKIILPSFNPSKNNNELLLLACRLKYKSVAWVLLSDQRVNPFDNDAVIEEVFMLIKWNKWNDFLEHLLNKYQLDFNKKKQIVDKYNELVERFKCFDKD